MDKYWQITISSLEKGDKKLIYSFLLALGIYSLKGNFDNAEHWAKRQLKDLDEGRMEAIVSGLCLDSREPRIYSHGSFDGGGLMLTISKFQNDVTLDMAGRGFVLKLAKRIFSEERVGMKKMQGDK